MPLPIPSYVPQQLMQSFLQLRDEMLKNVRWDLVMQRILSDIQSLDFTPAYDQLDTLIPVRTGYLRDTIKSSIFAISSIEGLHIKTRVFHDYPANYPIIIHGVDIPRLVSETMAREIAIIIGNHMNTFKIKLEIGDIQWTNNIEALMERFFLGGF